MGEATDGSSELRGTVNNSVIWQLNIIHVGAFEIVTCDFLVPE